MVTEIFLLKVDRQELKFYHSNTRLFFTATTILFISFFLDKKPFKIANS